MATMFLNCVLALVLTCLPEMTYRVAIPVAFDGSYEAPLDVPPEEKDEFREGRMRVPVEPPGSSGTLALPGLPGTNAAVSLFGRPTTTRRPRYPDSACGTGSCPH